MYKQREILITKQQLQDFETEICKLWESGAIKAPIHLSHGNEDYLIDLFQYIHPDDWVFSTWRNHYHALLHGVSSDVLKAQIIKGRSISFQSPAHRFYTSAIVNGILPIAIGVAQGIKWAGSDDKVWCFVGDMSSESGVFYEATKFAARQELPIHFIVEDNGLSTNTPTQEAWGPKELDDRIENYISRFTYKRGPYPHVGTGSWIHF